MLRKVFHPDIAGAQAEARTEGAVHALSDMHRRGPKAYGLKSSELVVLAGGIGGAESYVDALREQEVSVLLNSALAQ